MRMGFQCGVHYPVPIHLHKAFSSLNFKQGTCPVAEDLSEKILSLPMFPEITHEQNRASYQSNKIVLAMSQDTISISIIMPAYNEGPTVKNALAKTRNTFQSTNVEYEIIIVDDCSTDETGDIAKSFASKYPEVFYYRNEKNLGAGGAFKNGIEHASKDYVMFIPFDNPPFP